MQYSVRSFCFLNGTTCSTGESNRIQMVGCTCAAPCVCVVRISSSKYSGLHLKYHSIALRLYFVQHDTLLFALLCFLFQLVVVVSGPSCMLLFGHDASLGAWMQIMSFQSFSCILMCCFGRPHLPGTGCSTLTKTPSATLLPPDPFY